MACTLVLLIVFAHSNGAVSVPENFDESFRGWYSFPGENGEEFELVAVFDDGLGSIGTGSRVEYVVELRHPVVLVNFAYTDHSEFVVLVAPWRGTRRIFFPRVDELLAGSFLHGRYSRAID